MTVHQDQQYIEALLNNNTAMLNVLYEKYAAKIKTLVVKNNGSESDAADIFQDALLAIYQRAKNNNFVLTCPLEAYLYLICKTRWINELNRKGIKKVTFKEEEGYNYSEDSFKSVEETHNQYERGKLLQEKFRQMGEGCRQLLELSWSGISMEEVANKLGNSYGYVRKKKTECMAKLAALIKASPQYINLQW